MKQRWIAVALSIALLAACEGSRRSVESPTTPPSGPARAEDPSPTPTPTKLGMFADVRGWIAYSDDSGIWAADPANPDEDRVMLSPGEGRPIAWSSDGSKLLIIRGGPSPLDPWDLVVLNSDGTETLLVHGGVNPWMTGGSFTPDGSKVVYGANLPGKEWRSGIYVVDADGGSPRLVYAAGHRPEPDSFQMAVFFPTLSPDGSRIAYFEGMGDWGNYLWVMNRDGTDKHRIWGSDEVGHVHGLQWSPDGTRLAFESPGSNVAVIDADGSELSLGIIRGSDPHWSPDGSRIAFVEIRLLHTIAPDGSDEQTLDIRLGTRGGSGPWNPLEAQT